VLVTVLRWTVGVIAALLALGALLGLAVSVAFDNEVWRERTRRMRAWIYVLALAWFNVEVWGRVLHTLVTWGR
jgi:hypothetical protein